MIDVWVAIGISAVTAIVSGLLVWLFLPRKTVDTDFERQKAEANVQLATLTEKLKNSENEIRKLLADLVDVESERKALSEQLRLEGAARATAEEKASRVLGLEEALRSKQDEILGLREKNAELGTSIEGEKKRSEGQLTVLLQAKEALSEQFQNLANKIFEEKSVRFLEQNRTNLGVLLQPLEVQLKDFKAKVEETYDKESKQRFSLQNEIQKLLELNVKISEDAVNLTNALKGQSKTQGIWGELVLERVLEASGLQKGREYDVQVSLDRDDGKRSQPDVVVRLPENKHVIIDSKVSLTAYEAYCSAGDDDTRARELARHGDSIRRHVTELAEKNYQSLHGIQSLDMVLMFMPIERALSLAEEADPELIINAFRKQIIIVSPTNLLIALKTVSSLWQYENQNRYAQELARYCGALYDKFVGFVADLEDIGEKIEGAQGSYDAAFGKLTSGKGNLVRQVERIRQLGVKPSKALPPSVIDSAMDQIDEPEAK